MMKIYLKDGIEIAKPTYINPDSKTCIVNPTDDTMIKYGYEIKYVEETEWVQTVPYEERVVELIRLRYSPDQEYAILRQRDRKPEEFAEYDAYCEECKLQAKEGL